MTNDPKDTLQSVTVRLETSLLERLDAWGERNGVRKRTDRIRMLLTRQLDAEDLSPQMVKIMARLNAKSPEQAMSQLVNWFIENEGLTDLAAPEEKVKPEQPKVQKAGWLTRRRK